MRSAEATPPVEDRVVLADVDLTGADFAGRRMKRFIAVSSRFVECDFSGAQISQGGWFGAGETYSEYVDCVFDRGRFTRVLPGRATFVRSSFRDVRIKGMHSHDAEFIERTLWRACSHGHARTCSQTVTMIRRGDPPDA